MAQPTTTAYLLLDVADHPLALVQSAVREVLPLPHLQAPAAGSGLSGGPLAGFLNFGGSAIPVIDVASLLGLRECEEPDPYAHVVLARDGACALLVDKVADFVEIAEAEFSPLDRERSFNGCVDARITLRGRVHDRLDLTRLLTAEEHARVAAQAEMARRRLDALDAAIVTS